MSARLTKNFGRLADEVDFSSAELMRELGLLARERIIRRTLSGKDEDDRSFQSYSPGYARRKSQELGGGTGVNLQVSGEMLRGITITRLERNLVELGFKR